MRALRIAIATSGRFHVLDLARELEALGHEITFYSAVPRKRLAAFGYQGRAVSLLRWRSAAQLAAQRFVPRVTPAWLNDSTNRLLDAALARRLMPCDVLIAMSGIFVRSLEVARQRFGASVWLERGSSHILEQSRLLANSPLRSRPSDETVRRELLGYGLADCIVVPSRFVANSFHIDRAAEAKLFVNPYGVDVSTFTEGPRPEGEVLFVGTWSHQKGCDTLATAMAGLSGVRLTHIGSTGDLPLPTAAWFRSIGFVDQLQLPGLYRDAGVLVLPSRQDGFGMVLAQALASGLAVVCTDHTGGPDLAAIGQRFADRITVVAPDDPERLRDAILTALERLPLPLLFAGDRAALAWPAYAERYSAELLSRRSAASIDIVGASSTTYTGS